MQQCKLTQSWSVVWASTAPLQQFSRGRIELDMLKWTFLCSVNFLWFTELHVLELAVENTPALIFNSVWINTGLASKCLISLRNSSSLSFLFWLPHSFSMFLFFSALCTPCRTLIFTFSFFFNLYWEGTGPLLNSTGKPVTNSANKAGGFKDIFASVFTGSAGTQITSSSGYNNIHVDPPQVEGGLVCILLQGLHPHKSLGLGREGTDIVARPLSVILEKLWTSGGTPDNWKRVNVKPNRGPRKLLAH